ncbi:hypothetical protein AU468_10810 [Alkalispirochaeta sphaeroplastigenens]|uniref:Methyl-accepting transducer domain-containing protein n=1 Tax=Alkalispirochaeta sphaeroplastigenens TaxID=1187066 RepID=A0A2S4JHR3_9SPIO|nr:hypothetical protein [Alkalispirochaeta sphaeroplastigenens]POQ99098.1 hypothetical protein AU468_10810 [Alkalispirochaeta sphaeroplastigenens]
MTPLPYDQTETLVQSLKSIEKDTEKIFLGLSRALPALVQEMQQSLARSDEAIRTMADTRENTPGGSAGSGTLLAETNQAVQEWESRFQALSERETALFDQLRSAVASLETISSSIDQIKLDSEDMEIVSLNAMTVALKAGNAGRAFSYITEELKRLSNKTIALSDTVSRAGKDLITSFSGFESELEETRSLQESFFVSFQTRMTRSFEEFERAVESLIGGSRELREKSRELQQPINRMMEAIQLQDLIRQSIDHIIMALEVIKPEEKLENRSELLDELAFLRQIPPLAESLIEDVARQIDESLETFTTLTDDAGERLEQLDRERRDFVKGTVVLANQEEITFDALMTEISGILEELVKDLNTNLRRKANLLSQSEMITGNVEDLQNTFRTFHTLVNRFRSIDIAARIEVAKQSVLRAMGTSTEHMTKLTQKIGSDVESSLNVTQEFIETTARVMENYRTLYQEETNFADTFQSDMKQHYRHLESSREQVNRIISGFSLFTERFFAVFNQSRENGKKLRHTSGEMRALKDQMAAMRHSIESRYREALKEENLETWTIEDTRLREIIERFTIFTHKQQAGEIAGFAVEEGVAAGDVTLF